MIKFITKNPPSKEFFLEAKKNLSVPGAKWSDAIRKTARKAMIEKAYFYWTIETILYGILHEIKRLDREISISLKDLYVFSDENSNFYIFPFLRKYIKDGALFLKNLKMIDTRPSVAAIKDDLIERIPFKKYKRYSNNYDNIEYQYIQVLPKFFRIMEKFKWRGVESRMIDYFMDNKIWEFFLDSYNSRKEQMGKEVDDLGGEKTFKRRLEIELSPDKKDRKSNDMYWPGGVFRGSYARLQERIKLVEEQKKIYESLMAQKEEKIKKPDTVFWR